MKRVFADSFYFFAILNPRDPAHARVMDFNRTTRLPLVTTACVLTELADGLAPEGISPRVEYRHSENGAVRFGTP
jgi:hypothetical protein